jgi:hypothetical protein
MEKQDQYFSKSIYTIRQSQELDEIINSNGKGVIQETKKWTTGLEYLEEAKKEKKKLVVIFAPAEYTRYLHSWAIITDIRIMKKENQTIVNFEKLTPFHKKIPKTVLQLKNGNNLSKNHRRNYVLVNTPLDIIQANLGIKPSVSNIHYLQYWKNESVGFTGIGPVDHAASDQFKNIKNGDIVWIVTIDNTNLYLYGRIDVDAVVSQREAERLLKTENLWVANYHIIARKGTETKPALIDITDYAHDVRFQGKVDRLPDKYSGQHLQKIRKLSDSSIKLLDSLWEDYHGMKIRNSGEEIVRPGEIFPEEITPVEHFDEGHVKTIIVNKYERSSTARNKCIEKHGVMCSVCGFSFIEKYGELGQDYIHVHHIIPVAKIGKQYKVNPEKDLRPVCPNCHAMLHRYEPCISIEELKKLVIK